MLALVLGNYQTTSCEISKAVGQHENFLTTLKERLLEQVTSITHRSFVSFSEFY